MRTTRAASAVERLKSRSGEAGYSLIHMGDGRLALSLNGERVGEARELDAFVAFVNDQKKAAPKRVSKFEREFDEKLARARSEQSPDDKP